MYSAIGLLFTNCVMDGTEANTTDSDFVTVGSALTQTANGTGTDGGYFWSHWLDTGSATMTMNGTGNYALTWNVLNGNYVGGKGWSTGTSSRVISYNGTFSVTSGDVAYLTLYGWTTSPLIEYYVVESYGNWTPPGGTLAGTVNSDGGTYNLYKMLRSNAPNITGTNQDFYQYWSVRTSKRTSGTITFGNHVSAWASKGWNLGTHNYQIMATEGYHSSGNSNVTVSLASGTGGATGTGGAAATGGAPAATGGARAATGGTTSTGSTGCSCPSGCSTKVTATVPLTVDGVSDKCYFFTSLGAYVNSWNTQTVNINGTNASNLYVGSASYPAKRDGGYYLYLKSTVSYGHLEVR